MGYEELLLADSAPPAIQLFIREAIEPHLRDVHCMLRLPMKEVGLEAGCNFSIAEVLLNLISGVSAVLFAQGGVGRSGRLFKELLNECYWPIDPPVGLTNSAASDVLYYEFRNPFAHALGMHVSRGSIATSLHLNVERSPSISERFLYDIEMSATRPPLPATLEKAGDVITLRTEGLYWGVRTLIENLTADEQRMLLFARYLRTAMRT